MIESTAGWDESARMSGVVPPIPQPFLQTPAEGNNRGGAARDSAPPRDRFP